MNPGLLGEKYHCYLSPSVPSEALHRLIGLASFCCFTNNLDLDFDQYSVGNGADGF